MRKRYAVTVVACAVILSGTVTAVALTRGGGDLPGAGTDGRAQVSLRVTSFRIGGDAVRPLSPGRSAPIDVTVSNPRNASLRVTHLRVRLRAVAAPKADRRHPCSLRDFAVGQAPAGFSVTVAARASVSLTDLGTPRAAWPRVRMLDRPVNQDGCKGASLRLVYAGTGSLRR